MKTHNALSKALDIENDMETLPVPVKEAPADPPFDVDDAKSDYTLSRDTFRDLIYKGNEALEGITELAKESESPRAYEVLANLLKTVSETTKDLYDLQKKTKDLYTQGDVRRAVDDTHVSVDKAVFVGSTADLLQQLKEKNKSQP